MRTRAMVVMAAMIAGLGSRSGRTQESVYLEQGWTSAVRERFYQTYQGSQLMPYRWFLALESEPGVPFGGAASIGRFGYLGTHASPSNPDGLPIGFVKDHDPRTGDWLGFNCAACHTAQIAFKGQTRRIDGGPTLANYTAFDRALRQALKATLNDPARFAPFAAKLLGPAEPAPDPLAPISAIDREVLLRKDIEAYLAARDSFAARNRSSLVHGPGRLDALGILVNEIVGTDMKLPENYREPNAPVSYPALWLTPRLAAVEWNGSVTNPLERNIGEVLGVFGHASFAGPTHDLFRSTAVVRNLVALERMVDDLKPPAWPVDFLGAIERTLAERGRIVYEKAKCAECHGGRPDRTKPDYGLPLTPPNLFGKQFLKVWLNPINQAQTDPRTALNFADRTAATGYLAPFFGGLPRVPAAAVTGLATAMIARRQFEELGLTELEMVEYSNFQAPEPAPQTPNQLAAGLDALPRVLKRYKSGPLVGIWATAPYLHNGSVKSLYELLLPASQRAKSFWVGSREFDPRAVGYVSDQAPGLFELDTTLPGNANTGHEYTAGMADADRWALVEYLKTF